MKKILFTILLLIFCLKNIYSQSPDSLSVASTNFTSAIVQWQSGTCGSLDFIIEYKDSIQNNWISDSVASSSFNGFYSIVGLSPQTSYNWRVKCDSIWEVGPNFYTSQCAMQDSIVITDASCPNSNDGAIDLTVFGGTFPYSYFWSNNFTSEDLDPIGAGFYFVTITDIYGCTVSDTMIVGSGDTTYISQYMSAFNPNPVNGYNVSSYDTLQITNLGCDVNIRPEFIISHDSLPIIQGDFVAQWQHPILNFWVNLPYDIDNNGNAFGHWHSTSNQSNDTTGLTINYGSSQAILLRVRFLNNSSNTANYGTYTCSWVTNEVDNLGNIIRPLSNIDTASVMFINCNTYSIDSIASVDVSCNGGSDGSASLINIFGSNGNDSYLWSNGDTTSSTNNLNAGDYTLIVTDNNSQCLDSASITISDNYHQILFDITNPSCNGDSDGSVTATANEIGNFSYLWSTGEITSTISNLSTGDYILISTNLGCNESITDTISIINPDILIHSPYYYDNITCDSNICYGTIALNLSGGTQPYSYSWNTGDTLAGANNICAGTYIITSSDANLCNTFIDTIIILDSLTTLSGVTTLNSNDISCFGFNDGSASANIQGSSGGTQSLLSYCASAPYSSNNINIQNVTLYGDIDTISNYTPGPDTYEDYTSIMYASLTPNQTYNLEIVLNNISNIPNYQSGAKAYIDWNTDGDFDDAGEEIGIINSDTLPTFNTLSFTVPNTYTNYVTRLRIVSQLNEDSSIGPCDYGPSNFSTFYGATEDYSLVINATPPATYSWSNGATTSTINNLSTGTYSCVTIDAYGCSSSDSVVINEPSAITYTVSVGTILCNGDQTSATITVNGGTPPYITNWGASNPTRLSAGSHYFTITDSTGCSINDTIILSEPNILTVTTSIISLPTCFGASDGIISALASGGTSPFTYLWTNNLNNDSTYSNTLSNATGARYTCHVTDSNGCLITSSLLNVSQPNPITAQIINTNVSCNGLSDGATTLNISGGDQNYTINAFGNQLPLLGLTSFSSPAGIPAGTYPFYISDGNGCTMYDTIYITQPDTFNITTNISNISCFGLNDGAVTLNILGGTSPYFEDWGISDSSALTVGYHYFSVTDINNCSSSDSVQISEPTELIYSYSASNVSCFGFNDGTVSISISGGIPSYIQDWGNSDPLNLSSGIYNFSITDSNGCSISDSIIISQPDELIISSTINNVLCTGANNGSVSLFISGGTPSYFQDWGIYDPSLLIAGNYFYTVIDSNGCFFSDTILISEPDSQLVAFISSNDLTTCFSADGSIELTVSGGILPYTFLWNNNDTTEDISNLTAGNYSVSITDSNGCLTTNNVFIDQPSNGLSLNLITSDYNGYAISCYSGNNGTINANVSGGYGLFSYLWSNNDSLNSIINLTAGSYSVSVTDSSGCSVSDSITLSEPDELTSSFTTIDVACYGEATGATTLNISGGDQNYTINAFGQAQPLMGLTSFSTPSNIPAGIYPFFITDGNACTIYDTITINQPDSLYRIVTISNFNSYNISCNGASDGSFQLELSGGTSPYQTYINNILVSSPIADLDSLFQNTYSDTTIDANGCLLTGRVTLNQPQEFILTTQVINNVSCNSSCDGEIFISTSGGVSPYTDFIWANMSLNVCTFYSDSTLNTNLLKNLCAGEYTIIAVDGNGCQSMVWDSTSEITEPNNISISIDSITQIDTFGINSGSIYIALDTLGVNTNYLWTGPNNFTSTDQDIDSLYAGIYLLNIIDSLGCSLDTFIVEQPISLASYLDNIVHNICWNRNSGAINITPDGGDSVYTYLWTGPFGFTSNDQDIDSLVAGIYTLQLSDTTTTIIYSYEVLEPTELIVFSTGATSGCFNGSATATAYSFGGTSPYQTLWSNGSSSISTVLPVGMHAVTVTDDNGCSSSDSVEIQQADSISIFAIPTMVSCNGLQNGTINLNVINGGIAPYQYSDDNGSTYQTASTFYNLAPGTYSFSVLDVNGCTNNIDATITEPFLLSIDINQTYISCYGDCDASATAMVSNGTQPYFYLWNDTNSQITQTATALCSGSYNVTVTDLNGCIATELITINNPLPLIINIFQYDDMLEATSGFDAYQWLDNQLNPINGETSNQFYPQSPGEYSVEVSDSNGCSIISYSISFIASNIINSELELTIYPNPTSDYIYIDGATLISEIEIYNSLGDNVISRTNNLSAERIKIDLLNKPKGIYFIRIEYSNQLINHKIVLQ